MTDEGHYESVHVHFDDLDVMGLLHNSRYALLVERAIGAYWTRLGWSPDPATSAFKDVSFAVREFKISYEAPVMGGRAGGASLDRAHGAQQRGVRLPRAVPRS
ncbi:acyl-CoA thioesterase [Nonomuraea ferruginea]|uniref:acyl-CoA thioesterase n=1 Tax=Nonomuraea ferruginea TaxID=46174 RepID=UPI00360D5862